MLKLLRDLRLQSVLAVPAFVCAILSFAALCYPFIGRVINVSVVRWSIGLLAFPRRTVLFAEMTETFCTNCSVRCTIRRSLVLSYLTSDLFEFHLMLDQSQRIFAEVFRTSNPWNLETFTQNFWSSDFFGAWFFRVFKS